MGYLNGEKIFGVIRTEHVSTVDDELSLVSENPVQNKVVTNALNKKLGVNYYINQYNYSTMLPDLDDVLDNNIYIIENSIANDIRNKPNSLPDGICLFECYKTSLNTTFTSFVWEQKITNIIKNKVFFRTKLGQNYSWGSWEEVGYKNNYLVNQYSTTNLTDFNNASQTEYYFITDLSLSISNKPDGATQGFGTLYNYRFFYGSSYNGRMQILECYALNKVFTRYKFDDDNNWSSWVDSSIKPIKDITWLNPDTYSSYVTNWNDIKDQSQYYIFNNSVWNGIQNSPDGADSQGILICYGKNYYTQSIYSSTQVVIIGAKIFSRHYLSHTNVWSDWSKYPETRTKITIGASANADYSDLKTGLDYAFSKENCDVYIEDGIYDLSSSIGTIGQGIHIGKNNKYYFSSNSKVICNYTGNDTTIQDENSIFASFQGYGDFEIYNLTAEASNIRYIIHDDNGGTSEKPNRHIFNGCNLKLDNTNHPNKDTYYHCIGGGLGVDSYIELNSCIMNSVYVPSGKADAQYHGNTGNNETAQGGKSNLIVKNCYFTHTFSVQNPNNETQKKQLIFSGNSVSYDLLLVNTSTDYWEIYKWNNEIRNS